MSAQPPEVQPRATPGLRQTMANSGRAARLIWEAAPVWTAVCVGLAAAGALTPVASAVALKMLTDAAVKASSSPDGMESVAIGAALIGGLALAGHVVEAVLYYARDVQAALADIHIQGLIQDRSAAVDLSRYEDPAFHDTLHLTQREAAHRPGEIVNNFLSFLQNGLSLAGMSALLASLHWLLPAIIVLVSLPEFIARFRITGAMHRFHRRHAERARRAGVFGQFLTQADYAKEVRLYGLASHFASAFRRLRLTILDDRRALLSRHVRTMILTKTLPAAALFAGMIYLAGKASQNLLTAGAVVMFLAAFQQGQDNLRALLRDAALLHQDSLFLTHLFETLAMEPGIVDPSTPAVMRFGPPLALKMEDVCFSYPGTQSLVLDRVSMEAPAGATIALIGCNGAGKTTLTNLLTRLYEPDSGSILLDGLPLDHYRLADLRRAIAVITQSFARYPLTLSENVALGAAWREPDPAAIRSSLRFAGADYLERRLGAGLNTALTRSLRGGADLSLGEWQKVALARAHYRDASVVVLDEPTSAMDARAEALALRRLARTESDKTLLFITHRLSAGCAADCIYVLDGGRITESGSHKTLMSLGGVYAALFETQARAYREGRSG